MKVVVQYIFWSFKHAQRFAESYQRHPAGHPHQLAITCNDNQVDAVKRKLFDDPPAVFLAGDNRGRDIGAYQQLAAVVDCDLLVCFGASTYLRGAGWLKRMVESFVEHGRGLYGAMGNCGMLNHAQYPIVYPHIRTTAFWLNPALFRKYPHCVTEPDHRYPFEHGEHCLTSWVLAQHLPAIVVTWHGAYCWPYWENIPNGYHRGDQSELIAGDHLTEPPFYKYA